MREIKFRVWNGSKMLLDDKIAFVPPLFSTQAQTMRDAFDTLKKGYEVMQYTGLLDKNGVEIYEGDILNRGVVTFSRGKFQGTYFDSNGNLEEDWEDDLYLERNLEVIGNIYQNEELLKQL